MIITYLGHSCFKLEGKENQAVLITDPFNADYGLKVPKMEADILTISHEHKDHSNAEAVKVTDGKPFTINMAGEYEIKGVLIYGIPSYHDNEQGVKRGANIIYRIEMDNISIAHLGDLGHIPSNEIFEKLEGVDVLLIPVGGTYTIGAKEAANIISQIEPRIVVPMHYNDNNLKMDDIDTVEPFLKEMGVSKPESINKLKLTKNDLPQGTMQVVVMSP